MKLTEAKLKQMILEALKNSKFQDFGIPTPDEKLRTDLGDEMFDKIQSVDPEQSEIFKQSFDPNYPSRVKQESFEELLTSFGFKSVVSKTITDRKNPIRVKAFDSFKFNPTFSDRFYVSYSFVVDDYFPINPQNFLEYRIELWDQSIKDNSFQRLHKSIIVPDMFEIDLTTEEGDQTAMSLILAKEKDAIVAALEKYK